jgi:hypothetical protein
MALSAAYAAALARDRPSLADGNLWLELEGLPYGLGLNAAAASWFAARSAQWQREGILAVVSEQDLPSSVEQEAKVREGDASVGSLTVKLTLDDLGQVFGLVANTGADAARRATWVYLGAPRWKPATVYVSTGDVVRPTTSSGAAGKDKWFWCLTGGTSGASEPAWPATGDVADGTATWSVGGDQNLSTTAPSFPYTGTLGAAPLTIYLGRETIRITQISQGNGCGLVQVSSRARHLMEGQVSAWAHADGDVISTYPRFTVARRGRLYAALDGCVDADKLARWSGVVTRATMASGLLVVELELSSTWEQLSGKRKIFRSGMQTRLLRGVLSGAGGYTGPSTDQASANWYYDDTRKTGTPWTAALIRFFRCGDEVFLGTIATDVNGTPILSSTNARGCFGTVAAEHKPGDTVKEVIAVFEKLTPAPRPENNTPFSKGDNPLSVFLQRLLSRRGDLANGAYDVLPEGWGVGLDRSFVDVAGIEAIRDRWIPGARVMLLVEEPDEPREFFQKLLRPFALYPVLLTGDKLSVRRRAPPMPDTVVRSISDTHVRRVLSWEQDVLTQPVGLLLEADKEVLSDDYRQRYAIAFVGPGAEAQEFYEDDAPTVEAQAPGLYSGAAGFEWNDSAEDAAVELGEIIRDRDALPNPTVELECSYDVQDVEQGDYVYVTDNEIPDVTTGARGVTNMPMEVISRAPDDDAGAMRLRVQQVPRAGNHRLVAPSAVANSVNAGTKRIYPEEHLFTPAAGARDLTHFAAGDVVAAYSPDLATKRGEATVAAVVDGALGVGYVELATWPTGTAAADALMLSDYGTATAARKARNAYLCDSLAKIGSDEAHHYA